MCPFSLLVVCNYYSEEIFNLSENLDDKSNLAIKDVNIRDIHYRNRNNLDFGVNQEGLDINDLNRILNF